MSGKNTVMQSAQEDNGCRIIPNCENRIALFGRHQGMLWQALMKDSKIMKIHLVLRISSLKHSDKVHNLLEFNVIH